MLQNPDHIHHTGYMARTGMQGTCIGHVGLGFYGFWFGVRGLGIKLSGHQ